MALIFVVRVRDVGVWGRGMILYLLLTLRSLHAFTLTIIICHCSDLYFSNITDQLLIKVKGLASYYVQRHCIRIYRNLIWQHLNSLHCMTIGLYIFLTTGICPTSLIPTASGCLLPTSFLFCGSLWLLWEDHNICLCIELIDLFYCHKWGRNSEGKKITFVFTCSHFSRDYHLNAQGRQYYNIEYYIVVLLHRFCSLF